MQEIQVGYINYVRSVLCLYLKFKCVYVFVYAYDIKISECSYWVAAILEEMPLIWKKFILYLN